MALTSGVIFGLLAMVSFGMTDFLAKIAVAKISPVKAFFYSYIIGTLPVALVFMLFPKMHAFDKQLILLFVAGAIFNLIGYLTMMRSFEMEKLSAVYPVITMYPLVVVALGIFILNEKLSFSQGIGITSALIGLFLISLNRKMEFGNKKAIYIALISMITWGITSFVIGYLVKSSNWLFAAFFFRISTLGAASLLVGIKKIDLKLPKSSNILLILILLGAADGAGTVLFNLGVSTEAVSLIGPIAALSPVIVILLALFALKERISNLQKLGIIGIITGLVIIAF